MNSPTSRETQTLVVLGILAVVLFLFPVRLRVGMDWYSALGQLGLTPRTVVRTGYQYKAPSQLEVFLLPDRTCVQLVGVSRDGADEEFVLEKILVGPRGGGVPEKSVRSELMKARSELSLAGYGYPRLLSYLCALVLLVSGIRRYRAGQR